ncbi:STAS domain-containing protein [Streptomyces albidochromogenes]|uniref:Anti-sigma factor antagonist n=1 Tax=Streptomyces albidochromogenes TaxID=329524 RepID=A0ABW6FVF9_9ACTN
MNDTFLVGVHATGPDSCRITLAGDLDVVSAPDLRQAVQAAVAGHRSVLVDCRGLTFCDCSGLNALLGAARAAKAGGADLRLCAVPRALARLLRLSHTGSAFTIEPEPADAR